MCSTRVHVASLPLLQAQDSSHVRVERVYSTVNEQLNNFSVEKLMKQFVESKGTGREKPGVGKCYTMYLIYGVSV